MCGFHRYGKESAGRFNSAEEGQHGGRPRQALCGPAGQENAGGRTGAGSVYLDIRI